MTHCLVSECYLINMPDARINTHSGKSGICHRFRAVEKNQVFSSIFEVGDFLVSSVIHVYRV